jgi:hypothetical protein
MFASRYFTDVFSFLDCGLPVGGNSVSGTHSGSPMQVGGSAAVPWRKVGFILEAASGSTSAGTVTFYLVTATASNGAYATFTTANQSNSSVTISPSAAGKAYLYAEARGEMFTDLGTSGYWIKPVLAQSAVVCPVALTALGFVEGSQPTSNYNDSTLFGVTTFFML